MTEPLLSVRNLSLGVQRKGRPTTVIVDDISFDVAEGERLGIVGESGSGKSMTLRAIANLLPGGVEVLSGSIEYRGKNLQTMPAKSRLRLAGPDEGVVAAVEDPVGRAGLLAGDLLGQLGGQRPVGRIGLAEARHGGASVPGPGKAPEAYAW